MARGGDADSGIGRAIALQLAREGAAVVINFAHLRGGDADTPAGRISDGNVESPQIVAQRLATFLA